MAENRASGDSASRAAGGGDTEGVPCWVEAQLPDVEAGKRFYGELFGWTFEDRPDRHDRPERPDRHDRPARSDRPEHPDRPDHPPVPAAPARGRATGSPVWARLGGAPVAGLARKPDGRLPTVWTVYFATPDARALAGRIERAGGQVVGSPLPVGTLGTAALAADPQGAVFGLWQPAGHPGFGRRHEPGTFTWAELYTTDTEAANAFYGGLFHDALFGPDAEPDFGRAPVSAVFPAEMPPHFLVHFRVMDCAAAVGAVTRLGGRVQAPPFTTSYGRVAVVGDDQGASFALLER
ncbi:VOC family protein [Streptomyces leeuwenhoekii]|uniref:VOC family protein n=1 Tax=Streptomyces leeuwenhoekii TaxID=1437453 RepID=UPI0036754F84